MRHQKHEKAITCGVSPRDGGFSLIETLVSMLILVVVAVPLLHSFAVTAMTSAKAKQIQYADDFAQQVIETMQSDGAESVFRQFWNGQPYSLTTNGHQTTQTFSGNRFSVVGFCTGYSATGSDFAAPDTAAPIALPETGDPRYYTISGADSNGRKYDVQITYDPAKYGSAAANTGTAYNVNNYPDAGVFSRDSTAVINPNGAYVTFDTKNNEFVYDENSQRYSAKQNSSFENIAADAFYTMYTTFHQNACEIINAALDAANVDNKYYVSMSDITSVQDKTVKESFIRASSSRTTTVLASEKDNGISVTATILFRLNKAELIGQPSDIESRLANYLSGNAIIDNTGTELTAAQKAAVVAAVTPQLDDLFNKAALPENLSLEYKAYYNPEPFSELRNIYLMYSPLPRTWQSDTVYVDISALNDTYSSDNRLGFYLVPQLGLIAGSGTDYSSIRASDYIKPLVTGGEITYEENNTATGEKVNVTKQMLDFTRIQLNYLTGYMDETGTFAAERASRSIVAGMGPQDVLYNITVRVYKHSDDDTFSDSNYLTEMTLSGI